MRNTNQILADKLYGDAFQYEHTDPERYDRLINQALELLEKDYQQNQQR